MSLCLNPVDVIPTVIAATPAPTDIPSHASVTTIPKHDTSETNNWSDSYSSDDIPDIIDMGIPPASTVALCSLHAAINNTLSLAQVSLQE